MNTRTLEVSPPAADLVPITPEMDAVLHKAAMASTKTVGVMVTPEELAEYEAQAAELTRISADNAGLREALKQILADQDCLVGETCQHWVSWHAIARAALQLKG